MILRRFIYRIKLYRLKWLMLSIVRRAAKNDDLVRMNWWLNDLRQQLGLPLPDPMPSEEEMIQDLKRDKLVWVMYRLMGGPARP